MRDLHTLSIEASWEVVTVEEGDPAVVTVAVSVGGGAWLMTVQADLSGDKRERFREAYGL